MSAVWEMDLPQTEKMVLLCLSDHANDEGVCWPSMSRLARKCSIADRTVQRTIKELEKRGILTVERAQGRTCKFNIDPRQCVTPDTVSPPSMTTEPPTQCRQTPDAVSPEPSENHQKNRHGCARETVSKKNAPKVSRPDDVGDQVWQDFKDLRKTRRAPITPTVIAGIRKQAEQAGWSLHDALAKSVERGWTSFEAAFVQKSDNGGGKPMYRQVLDQSSTPFLDQMMRRDQRGDDHDFMV